VLIVPIDHPWAQHDVVSPEDLPGADFIIRDRESGTREEVETVMKAVGVSFDELNVVMEIGNSEAISMAVEEGIGAAFVSRTVARRAIELGRIKEVRVAGMSLQRDVFMVYCSRHPASRAQIEFWDFVTQFEVDDLGQLFPLPEKPVADVCRPAGPCR